MSVCCQFTDVNGNIPNLFPQAPVYIGQDQNNTSYTITYLLVGGGGGCGNSGGGNPIGGGGAGGVVSSALTIPTGITINVSAGLGGLDNHTGDKAGYSGGNSTISIGSQIMIAYGGGGGGGDNAPYNNGLKGGSGGGGGGGDGGDGGTGGSAIVVSTGIQGFAGVSGNTAGGGGGGGATSIGTTGYTDGVTGYDVGGTGGAGYQSSITGTATYYSVGGGGSGNDLAGANGTGWGGYGCGGNAGIYGFGETTGFAGCVIFSIPTTNYSGKYTGKLATGYPLKFGQNTILLFTGTGTYTT